uniref:Peptide HP n=1 Tax=Rattus norvegicus TaxID=10116 RepID=O88334_RAT|nr:peptide HP (rs14) [Rattus norvegicus]AAC27984.1 peptide HP [Rattus norvegicus]
MEMMHVVLVPALARLVFQLQLLAMVTLFVVVMQDILVLMELIVRQAKLHAQHVLMILIQVQQAKTNVIHVVTIRSVSQLVAISQRTLLAPTPNALLLVPALHHP